MFIVHNELDDGWMWVTNVRTEEQGLIVEDLVEEVVSVLVYTRSVEGYFSYMNSICPCAFTVPLKVAFWSRLIHLPIFFRGGRRIHMREKCKRLFSKLSFPRSLINGDFCVNSVLYLHIVPSFVQLVSRKDHQARGLQPTDDRYQTLKH